MSLTTLQPEQQFLPKQQKSKLTLAEVIVNKKKIKTGSDHPKTFLKKKGFFSTVARWRRQMSSEEAAGFIAGTTSAARWRSFASNSTSNFEDTSPEQFYVPLAPPHPQRCPVAEWSNVSPEIISSHAWCLFCQGKDANANTFFIPPCCKKVSQWTLWRK